MGSLNAAAEELQRAVDASDNLRAPETLYGRYFLAACLEKQRKLEGAVQQWKQIHAVNASFRDVADKLSKFGDVSANDTLKDFVTANDAAFEQLCRDAVERMGFAVQEVTAIHEGCAVVASEAQSNMQGARRMSRLIHFVRAAEEVPESTIRSLHDAMRQKKAQRATLVASTQIGAAGRRFAQTRPITLYDRDHLAQILGRE